MTQTEDSLRKDEKPNSQVRTGVALKRTVSSFPAPPAKFRELPASVLIDAIDSKFKTDKLYKLAFSPQTAQSMLIRNPPSVLIKNNRLQIDGDVIRTYSLLKRLEPHAMVHVVYISEEDCLAGMHFSLSEVMSSWDRSKQVDEVVDLLEIDRGTKVKNVDIEHALGLSKSQVSKLRKLTSE